MRETTELQTFPDLK